MPLDTNNPAQDFTENITFIQDLTKDKLCELLTAATREISELKAERDMLKAELERLSNSPESIDNAISAFMQALADNNMAITIKHDE